MDDILKRMQMLVKRAYVPYSSFPVAALVCCDDASCYEGVNIENASFGLTMCAERNAIYHAYLHHHTKEDIHTLILYTRGNRLTYPCGACLQVMKELLCDTCKIIVMNDVERKEHVFKELLPYAFDKEDLNEF